MGLDMRGSFTHVSHPANFLQSITVSNTLVLSLSKEKADHEHCMPPFLEMRSSLYYYVRVRL
jgi:hypothetical protein